MKQFQKYIILWVTQSISQLGSSMTGFVLTLWAYGQTHSALAVSLMTFCNYVPYIIMSLFAGSFVDRHSKNAVMLIADSMAAVGTMAVLLLMISGKMEIWHIYLVNAVVGCSNAFQQPASAVAVFKLVPEEKL
jgi:MFS transporter, DHA3 family, macrolide efflux protein